MYKMFPVKLLVFTKPTIPHIQRLIYTNLTSTIAHIYNALFIQNLNLQNLVYTKFPNSEIRSLIDQFAT